MRTPTPEAVAALVVALDRERKMTAREPGEPDYIRGRVSGLTSALVICAGLFGSQLREEKEEEIMLLLQDATIVLRGVSPLREGEGG